MLFGFPGCGIWIVCLLIVLLSTNFYFVLKLLVGYLCVMWWRLLVCFAGLWIWCFCLGLFVFWLLGCLLCM